MGRELNIIVRVLGSIIFSAIGIYTYISGGDPLKALFWMTFAIFIDPERLIELDNKSDEQKERFRELARQIESNKCKCSKES